MIFRNTLFKLSSIVSTTTTAVVVLFFLTASIARVEAFEENPYGVRAYECDAELKELKKESRLQRIQGSLIRLCFAPDDDTIQAGIGIQNVLSFVWRTNSGLEDGDANTSSMLVHEAVRNGEGDGVLSAVTCQDDGSICVLESMLPTKMYIDTGSIYGDGYVTLNDDTGSIVPVKRDMFHTADDYFGQAPGQCMSDTIALMHSNPILNDATEKYQEKELQNGVSGGLASMELSSSLGYEGRVEEVIIGSTLSISVPPDDIEGYKSICTESGGTATELPDTVVLCPYFNQMTHFQMVNGVSCLASTTECDDMDTFDVLMDAFAVLGFSGCKRMAVTESPTAAPASVSLTGTPTDVPTEEIIIDMGGGNGKLIDLQQQQQQQQNQPPPPQTYSEIANAAAAATTTDVVTKKSKSGVMLAVHIVLILFVVMIAGMVSYRYCCRRWIRNRRADVVNVESDGADNKSTDDTAAPSYSDNVDANNDRSFNDENNDGGVGVPGTSSKFNLPKLNMPPLPMWSLFNRTGQETHTATNLNEDPLVVDNDNDDDDNNNNHNSTNPFSDNVDLDEEDDVVIGSKNDIV